jgi:hypothetical protein
LVVAVFATVLTAGLLVHGPTIWTSQTTMLIDDPYGVALSGNGGELATLAEVRVKYASLASTYALAQPVATALHVPPQVVLSGVSVDVPSNSLLLVVIGRWSNPGFARELSSGMAQEITTYIQQENTTFQIPTKDQFTAVVVSPATMASPSGPSIKRAALASFAVFVGSAAVIFVLIQLIAGRRRS